MVLPLRSASDVSSPALVKHITRPVSCQVIVYPVPPQVLAADLASVTWNCAGLVKPPAAPVNFPAVPSSPR